MSIADAAHRHIPPGLKHATVLCVLFSGEALLLLRRAKPPNRGLYVPVGGHLAPHESPQDAARREVREETGRTVERLSFCGVMIESAPTDYNWINWIYAADVPLFDPPACNEGTLEWVPRARLEAIATPATDRYIYRCIASGRRFVFNALYDRNQALLRLEDELSGEVLFSR